MARFNRRTTAEQASEGIDLNGVNVLVTGANTGIGKETVRVLALRGANITMACRDLDKAEAARQSILDGGAVAGEQLDILQLDLNDLSQVRVAAAEYLSWQRPLHLLVNNAGIMIPMERRTADNFEAHFGINHLGHFLFTLSILDALKAARGARVVVVSSAAMAAASLTSELHDLNWDQRKFSGMKSYGDSKLMNLMFARELTRRYHAQDIVANALHPGVIGTELARDHSGLFSLIGIFALPFMKTIEQGAATSVYAATASQYATTGGIYLGNCSNWNKKAHKLADNEEACAALWRRSEELVDL